MSEVPMYPVGDARMDALKPGPRFGSSTPGRDCEGREPGNLPVVYLVTQDGIWGTGSDDVGLIQSTKAPKGPHVAPQRPLGRDRAACLPRRERGVHVHRSCCLHHSPAGNLALLATASTDVYSRSCHITRH